MRKTNLCKQCQNPTGKDGRAQFCDDCAEDRIRERQRVQDKKKADGKKRAIA